MKATTFAIAAIATAIGLAAPVYADPDTDFDHQLNTYGIYGPHDYNPYLAKIACHRIDQGVDPTLPRALVSCRTTSPEAPPRYRSTNFWAPQSPRTAPNWRTNCRTFRHAKPTAPGRGRQGQRQVGVVGDAGRRGDDGGDRVDRRHRRHDVAEVHEVRDRLGLEVRRRQEADLGGRRSAGRRSG